MDASAEDAGARWHGPRLRRTIIVGGSVAGTLAAAAVSPYFDEVLVVDRDRLPDAATFRKGVPQGAHFHALLAAGRRAMDELLPGFSERAFSMGAARLDSALDVMRLDRVGWSPRFASTLEFLMASRPLIEGALRDRARMLPNVVYRNSTEVTGLVVTDGHVTAVRTADGEELSADLIVDASGRSSRAPEWLAAAGYSRPVESVVNAHWGYSSTFLRVPENWDPGFRALAVTPFGQDALTPAAATRAMAMWEIEGDRRWILTVQGSAGDHPPRDEARLREFVSSIGVPELDRALSEVEFPEPISLWRDTRSRLRDYPAQTNRPEGFLAFGDSWMGFNPVYGQGMTAAAITATYLRDEIGARFTERGGSVDGLAACFYTRAAPLIEYCWNTSNTLDFRIPGVEVTVGDVAQQVETTSSDFADRMAAYMAIDQDRYTRYRETTQLLRTPEWLQSDEIVHAVKENWDELGAVVVPR
jgi:2-polyprenyl-6-methoxyphenol hydroxylase-like FAD-dependent oxidoreductase